ncbi:hypothetical protein [Cetobacterium sp.]|uniref:hypothetical protein n=1 Tax=Cetobacterium sp. TaxID=2071632 RepID=UPI003F3000B6
MDDLKIHNYLKNKKYKELEGYLESSISYEKLEEGIYLELLALLKYKNKRLEESKAIFEKIKNNSEIDKKEKLFNEESVYSYYKKLLDSLKNNDNKRSYKYIEELISLGERDLIHLKRRLYIKDKKYIKAIFCK